MKHLTLEYFKTVDKEVYVRSNGPGMLLVHAEWCGHCVRFIPQYKQLGKKLEGTFPCLAIEESHLNNEKGKEISKKIGVMGYPSLFFFNESGKIIEMYNGKRENGEILDKVCKVYHKCA